MAKRRERQVLNPLNMDHVAAIGHLRATPGPEAERGAAIAELVEEIGGAVGGQQGEERPYRQPERPAPGSQVTTRGQGLAASPVDRTVARHVSEAPRRRGRDDAKDTHQLKTRFSPQEAEQIEDFRLGLERRLGVKLRGSQISRALWTLALRAEDELDNLRAPELDRPSYGDPLGMAAFEDVIAEYLLAAIKRARR
jgi:hypothetical protein